MSEGAQFKLEDKIKKEMQVQHVIYNPIKQQTQVLVNKKEFYNKREQLKVAMTTWTKNLDPEVAHVTQDDYSTGDDSFFSASIESIMSFDVEEVDVSHDTKDTNNMNPSTSTSEISMPALINKDEDVKELKAQINKYQQELSIYVQKVDQIHTMLESLLKNRNEDDLMQEGDFTTNKKTRRPT